MTEKPAIQIKILSYKSPQRYAVKRTLMAAQNELRRSMPDLELAVTEVKDLSEMEKYTAVVILPSLLVNEKLVCIGRFPKKDEVVTWLREAVASSN
jgi:hypothetical protein